MSRKYYIPFYGMAVGVVEYCRAVSEHHRAMDEYKRRETPQALNAVQATYSKTWDVLERETTGFMTTFAAIIACLAACSLWAYLS